MAKTSSRILIATAMTLALSTAATPVVFAQTTDSLNDRAIATERDTGYGWLGLLGLIGLFGLKRRDDHTTTTTTHPTR